MVAFSVELIILDALGYPPGPMVYTRFVALPTWTPAVSAVRYVFRTGFMSQILSWCEKGKGDHYSRRGSSDWVAPDLGQLGDGVVFRPGKDVSSIARFTNALGPCHFVGGRG